MNEMSADGLLTSLVVKLNRYFIMNIKDFNQGPPDYRVVRSCWHSQCDRRGSRALKWICEGRCDSEQTHAVSRSSHAPAPTHKCEMPLWLANTHLEKKRGGWVSVCLARSSSWEEYRNSHTRLRLSTRCDMLIAVPVLLHCREMVTRWFSTWWIVALT